MAFSLWTLLIGGLMISMVLAGTMLGRLLPRSPSTSASNCARVTNARRCIACPDEAALVQAPARKPHADAVVDQNL